MLRIDAEGLGDLYPSAWCEIPIVTRAIGFCLPEVLGHTEFGPSDSFAEKCKCKKSTYCF